MFLCSYTYVRVLRELYHDFLQILTCRTGIEFFSFLFCLVSLFNFHSAETFVDAYMTPKKYKSSVLWA